MKRARQYSSKTEAGTWRYIRIIFVILAITILSAPMEAKYHPRIHWQEISNAQFIVAFPQGYEATAIYTLETATRQFRKLHELWGHQIPFYGPIRILLTDSYDTSNGLASFFPFNNITIYLFNPPPDSELGSYDRWLDMVLSHELSHIFNFNIGSGFTYFLRKLFGNNPAFFPIVYAPSFLMEGMAIFGESYVNRWGRLNTPDFRLMMKSIVSSGNLLGWDEILGNPTCWPGSNTPYLYGAVFMEYLAETYGYDKLPEFIRVLGRFVLPMQVSNKNGTRVLSIKRRYKLVFGKDLGGLWDDFNRRLQDLYPVKPTPPFTSEQGNPSMVPVHWLTTSGKTKKYPIVKDDGSIIFIEDNYKKFPTILQMDPKTGERTSLREQAGLNSMFYDRDNKKLYFSADTYFQSYYRYSDIYTLNPRNRRPRRLTRGQRLSYPVTLPGDSAIYCIKRVKTLSHLCRLNPDTGKQEILSEGFSGLTFLAPSPDGNCFAVSLKQPGKNWAIAIMNKQGQLERMITSGQQKAYYPQWKSPQVLYFILEHRDSYRLARYDLEEQTTSVYDDDRIPAIRTFTIGPDADVTATFFSANGFNLGRLSLSQLELIHLPTLSQNIPLPQTAPTPEPTHIRIKKYRFLRELFPKYFSPNFRKGGKEYQPGVLFSGQDLVGKNAFSFQSYYGFKSKTGNVVLDYTYDGLFPTLKLSYSDLSDYYSQGENLDYIHNEREFELSALTPLYRGQKKQWYLYTDFHMESISDNPVTNPDWNQKYNIALNGLKAAIFYNSAHSFYDSFSFTDGSRFSLSYSGEMKFLGSDYHVNTAAFELKHYISFPRPNVLALRFSVSDSWGKYKRLQYMGGTSSHQAFHTAGDDLFDLMRGYPSGYFTGTGGWLLNAEYRLSLFKVENFFIVIRSVERLYITFFADIGNLWTGSIKISPSYSLGTEFGAVVVVGAVRMNVSAGIATGLHPSHSPVLYIRIGNSF